MENKKYSAGFTLTEVMIVVAIVAILASIAMPAYGQYTERGRMMKIKSWLAELRQEAETTRLRTGRYPAAVADYNARGQREPYMTLAVNGNELTVTNDRSGNTITLNLVSGNHTYNCVTYQGVCNYLERRGRK